MRKFSASGTLDTSELEKAGFKLGLKVQYKHYTDDQLHMEFTIEQISADAVTLKPAETESQQPSRRRKSDKKRPAADDDDSGEVKFTPAEILDKFKARVCLTFCCHTSVPLQLRIGIGMQRPFRLMFERMITG